MIKKILIPLMVLLTLVGCSTISVNVDYDTDYNFNGKTKYAIVHSDRAGDNTLTNDRIIEALTQVLNAKSYKKVKKEEADLIFVFHVNVQDKTELRTDYQMVGYGGYGFGRGFGGGVIETTSAYNYTEGTLVVDALNPKTKKIVWRGIVKDELSSSSSTPEEKTAYIHKIITKLMEKFPKEEK